MITLFRCSKHILRFRHLKCRHHFRGMEASSGIQNSIITSGIDSKHKRYFRLLGPKVKVLRFLIFVRLRGNKLKVDKIIQSWLSLIQWEIETRYDLGPSGWCWLRAILRRTVDLQRVSNSGARSPARIETISSPAILRATILHRNPAMNRNEFWEALWRIALPTRVCDLHHSFHHALINKSESDLRNYVCLQRRPTRTLRKTGSTVRTGVQCAYHESKYSIDASILRHCRKPRFLRLCITSCFPYIAARGSIVWDWQSERHSWPKSAGFNSPLEYPFYRLWNGNIQIRFRASYVSFKLLLSLWVGHLPH